MGGGNSKSKSSGVTYELSPQPSSQSDLLPYDTKHVDVFKKLSNKSLRYIIDHLDPLVVCRVLPKVSRVWRMRAFYYYKLQAKFPEKINTFFDGWCAHTVLGLRRSIFDCGRVIFALHGNILDITAWVDTHPGGKSELLNARCIDASKRFAAAKHSGAAYRILKDSGGFNLNAVQLRKLMVDHFRSSDINPYVRILPMYADHHSSAKFVSVFLAVVNGKQRGKKKKN